MDSPIKLIKTYASFVKFAHTVFALPFAVVGIVAAYAVPFKIELVADQWEGVFWPDYVPRLWTPVLLILVCMISARSFAMAVNRIIDREIDALNPRTQSRELPAKRISLLQAWCFALAAAGVYFAACAMLGSVTLALSPIPITLMTLYPYTKRFTALCHIVLGATLGLAPVGAWVAIRAGNFDLFPGLLRLELPSDRVSDYSAYVDIGWATVAEVYPWLLGAAVMTWVAGFDIIYALQDDEFDRANKLHSIPAKLGRSRALWVSRALHLASAVLFFGFTLVAFGATHQSTLPHEVELPAWVWIAPCVMLAGMIYQHSLVRPNDLSRVNLAFFTVNGVISVVFGAVFLAAWLLA